MANYQAASPVVLSSMARTHKCAGRKLPTTFPFESPRSCSVQYRIRRPVWEKSTCTAGKRVSPCLPGLENSWKRPVTPIRRNRGLGRICDTVSALSCFLVSLCVRIRNDCDRSRELNKETRTCKVMMALTRAGWGPLQAAPNAACAYPYPAGPFTGENVLCVMTGRDRQYLLGKYVPIQGATLKSTLYKEN